MINLKILYFNICFGLEVRVVVWVECSSVIIVGNFYDEFRFIGVV